MKTIFSLLLIPLFFSISHTKLFCQGLPTETSNVFNGSGNCTLCHEAQSNNDALRDFSGNDISPVTLWRATMMANAAKDPLWQAKVTAEVLVHPQLQQLIEDKCTTCHSPLGRTEAIYDSAQYYSLQEMLNDQLALDGVSCTACHQIKSDNLGTADSFSGKYIIKNDRLIYGPFDDQFEVLMQQVVDYTPLFGEQTLKSELCAACHTLFTPTIDSDGNIAGEIAEQTPYLEWLNSNFASQNIECQTCHMPAVEEGIVISTLPIMLPERFPFVRHFFVGGNIFMLKILKDNATEIGVTASEEQFDSTIARTLYQLQNQTAEISASYEWTSFSELKIKMAVKNLAGHKFPAGYPSRRSWLHVEVFDQQSQSVFSSGGWDNTTGEINNLDFPYEQHYDVITQEEQVQIYEAMMQDVDGNVTYTLLRGASYIKDNRLPPEGFTSQGPHYDSTRVEGMANQDTNFNGGSSQEGTGIDTVTYQISNLTGSELYTVCVKMYYQSTTPRFIEDLFQYDTPEVNTFETYYANADKSPVLIDSLQLTVSTTGIEDGFSGEFDSYKLFDAYPNPFNPSTKIQYAIASRQFVSLKVYDVLGNEVATLVNEEKSAGRYEVEFNASSTEGVFTSGIYFYRLQVGSYIETKNMLLIK